MNNDVNPGGKRAYVKAMHAANRDNASTQVFRDLSLNRPGRLSASGRGMRAGADTPTGSPEREEAVLKWRAERPGGGSPSGATHAQWTDWGSRNPNRASMASAVQRSAQKKHKKP